jgi:ATP-dependent Clp protease ATP-binding subunit ClpC
MINSAKQIFKPELLNRFDDLIVFKKLDQADLKKILEVELAKLSARLSAKAITLELTPEAMDLLISKGFDPMLGARPLRRTVERMIEDPLAEQLLSGDFAGSTIVGAPTETLETLVFSEKKEKAPKKRTKKK